MPQMQLLLIHFSHEVHACMRVVATHIRLSKEIHAKKLQEKTESYERRCPERRELNPGSESGRGLPAVSV